MKTTFKRSAHIGRVLTISLFAGALTACCTLAAQSMDGNGAPRQPPAEAVEACKALAPAQECSFSSPHGAVKGSCWAPEGKPLACKPKTPPSGAPTPPKQ